MKTKKRLRYHMVYGGSRIRIGPPLPDQVRSGYAMLTRPTSATLRQALHLVRSRTTILA